MEDVPDELLVKERADERREWYAAQLTVPAEHFHGYSQKVAKDKRIVEMGSPGGYSAYWAGMDVGLTNHPSEIMVHGQRKGTDMLELLLRVQMQRVDAKDQNFVIARIFDIYGQKLHFGIDKTGLGAPIYQYTREEPFADRVYGFGFSEKVVVAIEDRELKEGEDLEDLVKYRNFIEASTDWLRNNHVDIQNYRLPNDDEVIREFQGQTVTTVHGGNGDPYGAKRQYSKIGFHALDGVKCAIGAKYIPPLEEMVKNMKPKQEPVYDLFLGGMGMY